ncbi:MAG: Helicase associated domain protein [Candidatus Gastranaerophilales bacterium]|nr:Helicase associated domain protein [Candidatus Gastranaerophilales bacterium]
MVDLLKHNQEAYEKVQKAIAEGKKKIAISHATGTGKSYLIAKLFEDYSNDKKLVLVPSTYISDQIQALFEKYDIQNVNIILYQRLIKMSDEDITAMNYDVIALDEYHHDTSKVWGKKVKALIESHPESIIFGTSATPVRSDGINTIDELFEGNCASDLPLSESIVKKIVPLPKYVGALYTLDDELEKLREKIENATNTSEEKKEFYKKINTMRSQIEKSYGMPIILNKHITNKDGKYIIFCKNKKHLREVKSTVIEWFKTAGFKDINAYEVYSDYENKDTEYKAFFDDTSHNMKLLFCVNMLNEGLHLENISGVLLLRPTRSMIVFLQQIGRAIEANNTNTPVIIDAVNNFSSAGQGMKLLGEIKDSIAKEKESNSNFNDSGFEDIDIFFVVEQIVEIQKMFKEIEGWIQNDWDLYIRTLKQYKEREGNCLVPLRHIEDIENKKIKLGQWVQCIRLRKKEKNNYLLTEDMVQELDDIGFVWDVYQYNCKICLQALKQYKEREGNCLVPVRHIEIINDGIRINLGQWVNKIRVAYNGGRSYKALTQEIIDELDNLNFIWKNRQETSFDKFYRYMCVFKKQYGHLDIKTRDMLDGYSIGNMYLHFSQEFKKGKLSIDQIEKLKKIGVDFSVDKNMKRHKENLELSRKAVKEGIKINVKNQIYQGVNLYNWAIKYKTMFSQEEQLIIEKLLPKDVRKPTRIKDVDGNVYVYSSISEAGRALYNYFHVVDNENKGITVVYNRISGYTKSSQYKGLLIESVSA